MSLDAEAVEHVLVAAPAATSLDLELEVYPGAELAFERAAGRGADLTDLGSLLADQDPLLRLGLGPDLGRDRDQAILAGDDLTDPDLDRVGNLLAGPVQDLLANQLGQQQLAGLVAAVVGRVHVLALGDELAQPLHQRLQALAGLGADREDLVD